MNHNGPEGTAKPPFDDAAGRDRNLTQTFVWVGVAALSAAVAFALVRSLTARQRPADETGRRIQQLIDEANVLLKTLDDQKR